MFAHGAGAGKNSEFMQTMAERLAQCNINVVRFDFPYMHIIETTGKRRPPDRADKLLQHYREVMNNLNTELPLFIGGKSMGGRIASMLLETSSAHGCVCMGYPFRPPGKPEKLRTEHLQSMTKPMLILQGERDNFGSRTEVLEYGLSNLIEVEFLNDGDHSLKPRKASGFSLEDNLNEATRHCVKFIRRHV